MQFAFVIPEQIVHGDDFAEMRRHEWLGNFIFPGTLCDGVGEVIPQRSFVTPFHLRHFIGVDDRGRIQDDLDAIGRIHRVQRPVCRPARAAGLHDFWRRQNAGDRLRVDDQAFNGGLTI